LNSTASLTSESAVGYSELLNSFNVRSAFFTILVELEISIGVALTVADTISESLSNSSIDLISFAGTVSSKI